MGEERLTLYLG